MNRINIPWAPCEKTCHKHRSPPQNPSCRSRTHWPSEHCRWKCRQQLGPHSSWWELAPVFFIRTSFSSSPSYSVFNRKREKRRGKCWKNGVKKGGTTYGTLLNTSLNNLTRFRIYANRSRAIHHSSGLDSLREERQWGRSLIGEDSLLWHLDVWGLNWRIWNDTWVLLCAWGELL